MYLIVSLNKGCNLNCLGCYTYFDDKKGEYDREEDLLKVLVQLKRIKDKGYNITDIAVLGREIFLMGYEDLKLFFSYVRDLFKRARISVQSNAVPSSIDDFEDKVKILKKYGVRCGVSYRGCKDLFEKMTRVKGSYDRFVEGLNILKDYKVYSGALMYIPKIFEDEFYSRRYEIYDDILKLDLKAIRLLETISKIPIKCYSKFLIDMQEYYIEKGCYSEIQVEPIAMFFKSLCGYRKFDLCTYNVNCFNHIKVFMDGDLGICESKSISFSPFDDICLSCPIFGFCKGGCPRVRNICGKRAYCRDRIEIYKYVLENLNRLDVYYNW